MAIKLFKGNNEKNSYKVFKKKIYVTFDIF